MCQFKSAIVLKNGDVIHNEWIDSHEDLVTLYNLKDEGKEEFVRVEYVPEDTPSNLDKYALKVDEKETPDWFNPEKTERKLRAIVKKMIITGDVSMIVGKRVILDGANVGEIRQSVVHWMKNSTVQEMRENSTVRVMRENSTVRVMWGNSTVQVMRGNSTVRVMWENSTVQEMMENSTVQEMRENSTVRVMWDNSKAPRKPTLF